MLQQTGIRLISSWGLSMNSTPDAIPMRLGRGNIKGVKNIDIVIMGEGSLNELKSEGKLIANSRVRLADYHRLLVLLKNTRLDPILINLKKLY